MLLSYSSYNTYKTCPRQYYFSRIVCRTPDIDDITNMVPGIICHHLAEEYLQTFNLSLFSRENTDRLLLEESQEPNVFLLNRWGSVTAAQDYVYRCAKNLSEFLTAEVTAGRRYMSEWWFGTKDEPLDISDTLCIQGAADLVVFNENGTAMLYDYKTSKSDRWLNNEQLYVYALAAREYGLQIPMAAFFLIPVKRIEYRQITDDDLYSIQRKLEMTSMAIDSARFEPKPSGSACRFCNYRETCSDSVI